jgi:hypothetical protein
MAILSYSQPVQSLPPEILIDIFFFVAQMKRIYIRIPKLVPLLLHKLLSSGGKLYRQRRNYGSESHVGSPADISKATSLDKGLA